jgi:predicted GNAT family acetyltransferase
MNMTLMTITRHTDATSFLTRTQAALLEQETAHNLMLGIALRLQKHPERIECQPYLTTVEEGDDLVAAAIMTPPHNVVVFSRRGADPAVWRPVAESLLRENWSIPGVLGPAETSEAFARVWTGLTSRSYRPGMFMRVYELRQVIPPANPGGGMRLATEADTDLVARWALGFVQDTGIHDPPDQAVKSAKQKIADRQLYIWEDGAPVSMAAEARPCVRGTTVSFVYTPPEHRRKGYAAACVADLSQKLLDSGYEFCSLFTNLANPISNSIYQKIGYRPVCDFNEYLFE